MSGGCWRAVTGVANRERPPFLVSVSGRAAQRRRFVAGGRQSAGRARHAGAGYGGTRDRHSLHGRADRQGRAALVQLFDAPEQADRAAASAKADFALLQLRRSQGLAPSGAESREVLEQRKAEAAQAVAAVRQLDARIEQKRVQAPFAGQIGIRRVNVGQYLNAGEPVATLTQLDPLYVNFTLPQQDLPGWRPARRCR